MKLDDAYEELGDLVSRASGQGYDAFEFVKDEIDRYREALTLAQGAISYAIEDHHLHGPECLCDAAIVTLRAGRDAAAEALAERRKGSS